MRIHGYEFREVGQPLVLAEREIDGPGAGQALIEIKGCGVCHTDLGFLFDGIPTRHPLPLVLGHEIAGVVVDAGPGYERLRGRNVIVPAVLPCLECDLCAKGRSDICRRQTFVGCDAHGGFASHVLAPARGLCPVPASVEGDRLVRLSVVADAVSTAYSAVKKSGLGAGDFAIFVGAGGVGGFGVQIARALGARVLAIDVDPDRLALIARHGAEWTLDARELATPADAKKAVKKIAASNDLPPIEWKIFETSGTKAGQECAFALLVHGASLGIVGYHAGDATVRVSNLMAFAARAEGTWGCPPPLFPEVLDLVLRGKVALDPFVEFHPMSAVNDVLTALKSHEIKRRPILVPDFTAS